MAYEIPGFSFPLPSSADYTGGAQFRFVDLLNTGKAGNPTAGGRVIGVRQNRPKANEAMTIVASGVSIVEAGGAVTAGDLVATNAVGQAVTAAAGNAVVGRALESATGAGIQIAVFLTTGANA